MSRRSAKYPRRRHERKTMRAVGDAGPCGVIAALTQQRRKAILARDAGAAAGMGAEAIRCTAICNIWVFAGYRAAGSCAVSRTGSLETCGFKQTFWSLLGLRPKVTRARGAEHSPPGAREINERAVGDAGPYEARHLRVVYVSGSGDRRGGNSLRAFLRRGHNRLEGIPKTIGFWRRSFPYFFRC